LPGKSPRKEVVLVTYPDSFTLEEAKSLVDSAGRKPLRVFTQKYLNHAEYGIGSGKAKELEEFVKESNAEQVIVDEHLTSKQIHNLEKLTGVQVIDRERLILSRLRRSAPPRAARQATNNKEGDNRTSKRCKGCEAQDIFDVCSSLRGTAYRDMRCQAPRLGLGERGSSSSVGQHCHVGNGLLISLIRIF
jgi:hypothetical protein